MSTYNTPVAHGLATGLLAAGSYLLLGEDANGLPCILTAGQATDDASIVTAIGAKALWADGSIYVSCVDGAGKLFLKVNDTWDRSEVS